MSNLLFKSQLQEYAQKACVSAPVYETTKDGPPHMPNFKASVTVNGIRYDCPEGFRNRKTAEHAAAQVALQELGKGTDGTGIVTNPVYETGLCKNLLQEYAQKLSLPVPSYSCSKIGEGNSATFTAVVEIAGISYQGGPGNSKKGAEIKAARTALSAIHAQQAFQAFATNPTTTPSDAFAGTWNSHSEVHAGMKRECEFDQSSERHKGKKNKRPKSLKKKKGIIQGSADKDEILGESSSKSAENGQQAAATENTIATNVDDQHKNLQEDTSMVEGGQTKLELGPCSQETGQTTENPGQSVENVAASAVGELQNGDIASNPVGNDENGKQEINEDTDKCSADKKGQNEHEITNPVVLDAVQKCEHDKNEFEDIASNPVGNDENGKHEMNEDTDKCAADKKGQNEHEMNEDTDKCAADKNGQNEHEMNEDTDKCSADKKGQNEHEITNPVVLDALQKCEHDKNESNQTLQEPPEKEDLKEHETPENLNQREVALPLET